MSPSSGFQQFIFGQGFNQNLASVNAPRCILLLNFSINFTRSLEVLAFPEASRSSLSITISTGI